MRRPRRQPSGLQRLAAATMGTVLLIGGCSDGAADTGLGTDEVTDLATTGDLVAAVADRDVSGEGARTAAHGWRAMR